MMQHEIQNFHLIVHLEFAVQTLYNLITAVTKILHSYLSVRQIGHLYNSICMQVGRADFLICGIKIGIALIFNL